MRPGRHRRLLAISTALLWLVAVEVLPNLHLAAHDGDHTHAADGSIHRHAAHEETHAHGGTQHRHRRPYPAPPSVRGDDVAKRGPSPSQARDQRATRRSRGPSPFSQLDTPARGHAALGISHHALATLDPSQPCLTPVGAPVATAWTHTFEATLVIASHDARPTARGPPIT